MLKRLNLENQIYFVTSKTFNNTAIFSDDGSCELFVTVLRECKDKYKFKLYGFVVMPDHIHLLVEPSKGFTVSQTVQKIKSIFAKEYKKILKSRVGDSLAVADSAASKTRGYAGIIKIGHPVWQKSFYDHAIRNDQDYVEKLNYIHKNPLKHNITNNLDKYIWSSYQNYYLDKDQPIEVDKSYDQ